MVLTLSPETNSQSKTPKHVRTLIRSFLCNLLKAYVNCQDRESILQF